MLILAFLLAMSHPLDALAQDRATARLFVYTAQAASGVVSDEEQGRRDSVEDLKEMLGGRKSEFSLVKTADEADVIVEVVNREERDTPHGGFGGASVTRFRETIVRVRIKSGNKQSELKGIGRPSWKSAAKDAAERIRKWVRNR